MTVSCDFSRMEMERKFLFEDRRKADMKNWAPLRQLDVISSSHFDDPDAECYHVSPASYSTTTFCDSSISNDSGCYSRLQSPLYDDVGWKRISSLKSMDPDPKLLARLNNLPNSQLAKRLTRRLTISPYSRNLSTSDEMHQPKSRFSRHGLTEVGLDTSSFRGVFCTDDIFSEQSKLSSNITPLSSGSHNDVSGLMEFLPKKTDTWEFNLSQSEQSSGGDVAKLSPHSCDSVQTERQFNNCEQTVDDWSLLYVYQLHGKQGKYSSQSGTSVLKATQDSYGSFATESTNHQPDTKASKFQKPVSCDGKKIQTNEDNNLSKIQTSPSNSISESELDGSSQKISSVMELYPQEFAKVARYSQGDGSRSIIELLLGSAEAVHSGNTELATVILVRLKELMSKTGDTLQRVAAYFAEGIECVLYGEPPVKVLPREALHDYIDAFHFFHDISPCLKFGYLAANQAIIEAIGEETSLHIVDYDIMEGVQWPSLMQALASRKKGAPHLTITAIDRQKSEPPILSIAEVGKQLSDYASLLKLPFSFHQVHLSNEDDIKRIKVQAPEGEVLVVNCMVHLPHRQRSQDSVLAFLREICRLYFPKILTFVENELTPTMSNFAGQILEILHYYCATFDSLKKGSPSATIDCTKVESMFFGPQIRCATVSSFKIHLAAAIESRAPREIRWSDLAAAAEFKAMPVTSYNLNQSKMLLEVFQDGYYLKQDQNRVILGWNSKPMVAFSSWRLCEAR